MPNRFIGGLSPSFQCVSGRRPNFLGPELSANGQLARKLIVHVRTVSRSECVDRGPTFDRCVVIDDDLDVLLSARLLLRDMFETVVSGLVERAQG